MSLLLACYSGPKIHKYLLQLKNCVQKTPLKAHVFLPSLLLAGWKPCSTYSSLSPFFQQTEQTRWTTGKSIILNIIFRRLICCNTAVPKTFSWAWHLSLAGAVQQHNETAPEDVAGTHCVQADSLLLQEVHQVQVSLGNWSWERQ